MQYSVWHGEIENSLITWPHNSNLKAGLVSGDILLSVPIIDLSVSLIGCPGEDGFLSAEAGLLSKYNP